MQFRFSIITTFAIAASFALAGCSTDPKGTDFKPPAKQGLAWRVMHPFAKKSAEPPKSGIQVTIQPESTTPSLAKSRQIDLKILVNNYTRKMVNLNFPSSQRIEILARNPEGKIIYIYSTDRAFTQEFANLTINPGERLQYDETLPLRDMSAGTTYLITASVVGYDQLTSEVRITPQP